MNRANPNVSPTRAGNEKRTPTLPHTYFIAVSSVCNISCPYCPRQVIPHRIISGLMPYEQFTRIVDQIPPGSRLYLIGSGEPLLHPRFFDLVVYAKERGHFVSTNTNAMLLTPANAAHILDSQLDELAISIDSADPETFHYLRGGADLKTVTRNIEYLHQFKLIQHLDAPSFVLACAVSRFNLHQLSDIVRYAARAGIPRVVFTNLRIERPEDASVSIHDSPTLQERVAAALRLGRQFGIEVHYFPQRPYAWNEAPPKDLKPGAYQCEVARTSLVIDVNGETRICCFLGETIGTIFSQPLDELVLSPGALAFAKSLREGAPPEICRECPSLVRVEES